MRGSDREIYELPVIRVGPVALTTGLFLTLLFFDVFFADPLFEYLA